MAEVKRVQIPRVKLGSQGFEVSKLGFGCMSLNGTCNSPLSGDEGVSIIKDAFNKGITFFDTADMYGANANEVLVGKDTQHCVSSHQAGLALKHLPREKVQLATKFGVARWEPPHLSVKGTPEYVCSCCEASLKRLDVEYIDLYYQHQVDTSIPIEETALHPRFRRENLEKNKNLYTRVENLAKKHRCTPTQLALAWFLHQGNNVVPIPGKTKIKNLDDNIGSVKVKLTEEDL
ncbi:hypothetical protein L1049_020316 [Liquidambar formosana]|uniref:NADP-dependent oxidoreductase domain-containing protein n=1 Tax=Liquidambar formosana TaxID=63359 RepID=A0AAP0S7C0_LIQFO